MLPHKHIFYGLGFVLLLSLFGVSPVQCSIIFLSSILIDFDHYTWGVRRTKSFNLKKVYYYFRNIKMVEGKKFMLVLHTVEFHVLILLLIPLWAGFFYIFIGMLFHSIIDIFTINLNEREFSFIKYLLSDKNNYR